MKRRAMSLLTVIGVALLLAAGVALAASTVDQQTPDPPDSDSSQHSGPYQVDGSGNSTSYGTQVAQRFKAGRTGNLDKVSVIIFTGFSGVVVPGDEVRASIQPLVLSDLSDATSSLIPKGIDSALAVGQTTTIPQWFRNPDFSWNWVDISLTATQPVEQGTEYALVMDTVSDAPETNYSWLVNILDQSNPTAYNPLYPDGFVQVLSQSYGQWGDSPRVDAFFKTYVDSGQSNAPPEAIDDSYSVDEDTTLSVSPSDGVLANDSDPDGDSLMASLVDNVAHGQLTLNSDGSFDYTPVANYNGQDTFTYKAKDPSGAESDVATVTINVKAVNDAPVAVDDPSYSATYDKDHLTGKLEVSQANGVLANDTDVDNFTSELKAVLVKDAAKGSLTLNEDGSFTYTPKAENFNGGASFTDTFTYKAKDPSGAESNTATVTISVGRTCTINGTDNSDSGKRALAGGTANDVICGKGGDDTIRGDGGNDLIFGDGGKDTLKGEDGDDVIVAKDGEADTIDCGKGNDTVLSYDAGLDKLASNCETKLEHG